MTRYYKDMVEQGFTVFRDRIDNKILYDLTYYKSGWDKPNRGHDRDGSYYSQNYESVEWGNYWTGPLDDHIRVADIRATTDLLAAELLDNPVCYHVDVSVLTPVCSSIRPHVDTPHRHEPWNQDLRQLGVQMAIPLNEVDQSSGTTAFVPGSHQRSWDIKDCYRGKFTELFLRECHQPVVSYGDVLVWDCRVLHSQMPNVRSSNRYMLLLNYLNEKIVQEVMEYEASLSS